jgi:GNAT superfamily N-acetyltransferase
MVEFHLSLVDQPSFSELMIERGLQAECKLIGLEPPEEIAVFIRGKKGQVIGGAQGELAWGWLYVDLVWLDETQRGQGLGRRLMTAIEQGAYQQGYPNCWLATTSFQALPFYLAIGYQQFGQVENRPPGHQYYFLQKTAISPQVTSLPVELDPDPHDVEALRRGLSQYNRQQRIVSNARRLAVFLEDEQGAMYGGLVAATYWGWLDIQAFWLAEPVRGQGHGRRILAMAEMEAARRGCPHAFADVSSFQARGFFEHLGYSTFGILEDRPPGHRTHFMRKALHTDSGTFC